MLKNGVEEMALEVTRDIVAHVPIEDGKETDLYAVGAMLHLFKLCNMIVLHSMLRLPLHQAKPILHWHR